MNQRQEELKELLTLCGQLRDESISNDGFSRLQDMLKANPGNLRFYVRYARLQSILERDAEALLAEISNGDEGDESVSGEMLLEIAEQERKARIEREAAAALEKQQQETADAERRTSMRRLAGLGTPEKGSQTRHYVIPKPLFYGGIAAVIAVCFVLIHGMLDDPGVVNDSPTGPRKPYHVADLTNTLDAAWSPDAVAPMADTPLLNGSSLSLTSGFAEITFLNGATVVMEGPSELSLLDEKSVKLVAGKLTGRCDEKSRGFTVETKNARIVDLGTEFGVALLETGETETHVFKGVVTLEGMGAAGAPAERITAGRGMMIDASGTNIQALVDSRAQFVRASDFASIKEQTFRARQLRGGLLAHWSFDDQARPGDGSSVHDLSGNKNDLTQLSDARGWDTNAPGKIENALRLRSFDKPRLSTQDGDAIQPRNFTVSLWMRVSRQDDPNLKRAVITRERRTDAEHWALAWGFEIGSMNRANFFVVNDATRLDGFCDTKADVPLDPNTWYHVVGTYDSANGNINIFIDGQNRSSTTRLGGTGAPDYEGHSMVLGERQFDKFTLDQLGTFDGYLDEISVWDRVLTDEEIAWLYNEGRALDLTTGRASGSVTGHE